MATITLIINNQEHTLNLNPEMPLIWVLRDILGLTGTKYGCGVGICGACVIHLNGQPTRACITPVAAAAGQKITTIEGLSPDRSHPLQRAWLAENVAQCGYCQPGQIMSAAALLAQNSQPSDEEIDQALAGNICRCGTYQRIRRAIHRAAQEI